MIQNKPKVSVILTSFNHAKYLREAIDSALAQTFTDFELIIWDDASTDNSWDIIQSYTDKKIKAFRNEKQRRGIYGINKAISEIAQGEYIAIHHSDDVWELDKLEKQVRYIDANYEIGAVFTWVNIIDENGVEKRDDWFNQENKTRWQWLNHLFFMRNHLAHPSVLIRKQCYHQVGLYRLGLAQSGDAEMWSRLLLDYDVHVIKEELTKHRLFKDNSNTSGKTPITFIRLNNEWSILRANLLSISCFNDLVEIFPSLECYRHPQGFNLKFLLAMVCILDKNNRPACQLGLSWLYDLFKEPVQVSEINELYSFTHIDLIKLTGEFDPYAVFAVAERDAAVTECDAAVSECNAAISARDAAVSERDAAVSERAAAVSECDAAVSECNAAMSARDAAVSERDAAVSECDAAMSERDAVKRELYLVYRSTSWCITKPLRAIVSFARSCSRQLRQGLDIVTFARLRKGVLLLKNGNMTDLKSALAIASRECAKRARSNQQPELIAAHRLSQGQPLVSVVIPCFNYGHFVVDAIESVLAQTLKNVEIVVVDGGSTDVTTVETLKGIQRPRTRILLRDGRHLVGDNRNYGIEKSSGRYICCLDADDTLDPTYLEKAVFHLETYGYDIVSTAINFVGARTGHLDTIEFPDLADMVHGNHVLTCAVFRKALWDSAGGYVDIGVGKHHVAEDWDFWVRLTAQGARIRNISGEYLFNYRIHVGGSLSSAADVKTLEDQKESILRRNKELLTDAAFKKSIERQSKFLRCDPVQTALAKCCRSAPCVSNKTLILTIPFFLVGGAERLLSGLCMYLSHHEWRVIVIATLPEEPGFGSSMDWFRTSTSEVYSLPNFLKPMEWVDFINYLLASGKPDCILNAGSRMMYEMLPSIKKTYENISVVDLLFNTVGHVASHTEFKKYISLALAENKDVLNWYIDVAGWNTGQVKSVSSGVDLKRFHPTDRPKVLVEKYSIGHDEMIVGFSGRLSEEKGPDVFVEIARLCQDIPNLRFIMTGTGPMKSTIKAMIKTLPAFVKFEFAGLVDDVDQYIALYDVLLLPSRFDGRPLVAMEALACGVVVVASDVGGVPDLIEDGVNGFLVSPANADIFADQIRKLAADRDLLGRLKVGARQIAEHRLDANKAYREYDIALREAIATNIVLDKQVA